MKLENGYKVIYEVAADGRRTFYASKSTSYPNKDVEGKIVDLKVAEFVDADYADKVVYEYKGSFYVSKGKTPAYDKNGIPTDTRLEAFDQVFVEVKPADPENSTEE